VKIGGRNVPLVFTFLSPAKKLRAVYDAHAEIFPNMAIRTVHRQPRPPDLMRHGSGMAADRVGTGVGDG